MKTCLKLKKRVTLYVSFFLIAGLATLHSVAGAAVNLPAFDNLASLAGVVSGPTDVAVDQQGRTYIAETNEDRVTILSQSGNLVDRLRIAAPISVAVDAGGRILVGGRDSGNVSVFSSGLGFLFKLGSGDGEFDRPMDIAVDLAGIIYVVDTTNHAINTYNSSGARIGSIGSPGNGAGQLHHPISIAVDENAGELVVLDLQQVYDPTTRKMIDGARIQYFDMNGISLRAYSKFGYNNAGQDWNNNGATTYDITMGQVTRPKQVAVDDMSRIYVTDARLQKVMVYDNADGFLGTLDNASSPFRIPMGLAVGASGRLYVASLFTQKVEIFGLENYTAMAVDPTNVLDFNVVENDGASFQEAKVTNTGSAPFTFSAESQAAWAVATVTSDPTLGAGQEGYIEVTVDPTGLTAANSPYTTKIAVTTGEGGIAEEITVILTVESNPLQVTPGSLSFETSEGTTPDSQTLVITSSIEGSLLWNAVADQPWISLSNETGNTESTVKVYVDISSLEVGEYPSIITFSEDGGVPVQIPVAVTIAPVDPSDELPVLGGNGKEKWNKKWTITQLLEGTANLNGVSGTSKSDAVAVGDDGAILHFDGKDWTQADSGTANDLQSVWSSSETDVNAVGAEGLVMNFDGASWAPATPGSNTLLDVWGDEAGIITVNEFGAIDGTIVDDVGVALRTVWAVDGNVYFAGEAGAIYNSVNGEAAAAMTSNTTEWLNGIWASSSDDVFAVGENGTIVHYDGADWAAMDSGITSNINGVCGTSATDVYAVGNDSVLLHYDGTAWTAVDAGAGVKLNDIWCSDQNAVIAVGDDGTVIYGHGGNKFPWNHVIQTIVDNAIRAKKEKEDDKK